jgi:hypothetical protein
MKSDIIHICIILIFTSCGTQNSRIDKEVENESNLAECDSICTLIQAALDLPLLDDHFYYKKGYEREHLVILENLFVNKYSGITYRGDSVKFAKLGDVPELDKEAVLYISIMSAEISNNKGIVKFYCPIQGVVFNLEFQKTSGNSWGVTKQETVDF